MHSRVFLFFFFSKNGKTDVGTATVKKWRWENVIIKSLSLDRHARKMRKKKSVKSEEGEESCEMQEGEEFYFFVSVFRWLPARVGK